MKRAWTVFFELDFNHYPGVSWWKPGYYSGRFAETRFRRIWWLCFSVSLVGMPLKETFDHIKRGNTRWTSTNQSA